MQRLSLCLPAAVLLISLCLHSTYSVLAAGSPLRFGVDGTFKILQVADMHYANGRTTPCMDVFPSQAVACSDLNTTAFLERLIEAERPDLIVFTGDNIFGMDATDAKKSLSAAFSPAISSRIPWTAVLGNHDQESTLSREGVMRYIVGLENTLSQVNPVVPYDIDGFGNYNLEIHGVDNSPFENKSVLNLYFLDSGDYSTNQFVSGFGWIKLSQQNWFKSTSQRLQRDYMSKLVAEREAGPAPGLAFFHIPLPEYWTVGGGASSNFRGGKLEGISSASVNSGFFTVMLEAGDVRAVFAGHSHLNDFCGERAGIQLCYGGGFGYHAYGKPDWARRARIVVASVEEREKGDRRGAVVSIKSWKRLDDPGLNAIDEQVLWSRSQAR